VNKHANLHGWQWAAGFVAPQVLVQITPLFWGLAVSWCEVAAAAQIGPVAIKLSWGDYSLEAFRGRFNWRGENRVWPR